MSNVILAQLSSDTICTALGITVSAPSPVLALCRKLTSCSTYAPETPMNVYRGKTLCLRVLGIGEAAQLKMDSTETGRPVFRRRKTLVGGSTIESESGPEG
jgi:hypothetical protein